MTPPKRQQTEEAKVKDYMIVETRDMMETRDSEWTGALATKLNQAGECAAIFLAENAVLAARAMADAPMIKQLVEDNVPIFADTFALDERGIASCHLTEGVRPSNISRIADKLIDGSTVIWR